MPLAAAAACLRQTAFSILQQQPAQQHVQFSTPRVTPPCLVSHLCVQTLCASP
jgi:hypothetical protein